MADRERVKDERKAQIMVFLAKGKAYTNSIAKELDVTWPVADRLLGELVSARLIEGDKIDGYTIPKNHPTLAERVRKALRRK